MRLKPLFILLSLFISTIILYGCRKNNRLVDMKIGNYQVEETRTYIDGKIFNLKYTAIGPTNYGKDQFGFLCKNGSQTIGYRFRLASYINQVSVSINDTTNEDFFVMDIGDNKMQKESFEVYCSNSTSLFQEYNAHLTFKYVE